MSLADEFDLRRLPADFYDNPFPYYAALQAESPVRRLADGSLFVTRYAEAEFVYKHPKIFSSDKKREFGEKFGATPLFEHHTTSLVFNDPPLHTRVRKLINGSLTPRAVAQIQPDLERLVDSLVDAMAAKGSADLIEDFAAAIPIEVIGNLLGVPRTERAALRGWSLAILGALEPSLSAEAAARGNRAVREFEAYLDVLIERRRKGGDAALDLITKLLQGEVDGQRLNRAELVQNCIFLLNAGHETTTNLIGNALVALVLHPAERERLIAEPALIKTAVEEFLRFESPNQLGNRITAEPAELGGIELAPGTQITLCIGAANRDPAVFAEPHELDIARAPNRHLAFGSGIHQCAGVGVARLEAAIAISRFLGRFPRYALCAAPTRGGRARFRGFLRVPCRLA
ncbi:MAG: cytochrome P450 [Steroidobacteraceae bacterium]